jgi:hypothetical protein
MVETCDKYRKNSGMITVETAMVFPLVVFAILAMLYVGLLFMDKAKVCGISELVVRYATQSITKSDDLAVGSYSIAERNDRSLYQLSYSEEESDVVERVRSELQGKLLILQIQQCEVSVKQDKMKVSLSLSGRTKIWSVLHLDGVSMEVEHAYEMGDYAAYMRRHTALGKSE